MYVCVYRERRVFANFRCGSSSVELCLPRISCSRSLAEGALLQLPINRLGLGSHSICEQRHQTRTQQGSITSAQPLTAAMPVATAFISPPLGHSIPYHTPHAVSVSLPTWRDNVGYEEGEKRVVESMQTGYPRFFVHRSIQKVRPAASLLRRAEALRRLTRTLRGHVRNLAARWHRHHTTS